MANKICLGTNTVSHIYLGSTDIDKSYLGEHLIYTKSLYTYKWTLNDEIDISTDFTYDVLFMNNGEEYEHLKCSERSPLRVLEYAIGNTGDFVYNSSMKWLSNNYKVIYFKEQPSGDLLTWLTANGTSGYAVSTQKVRKNARKVARKVDKK